MVRLPHSTLRLETYYFSRGFPGKVRRWFLMISDSTAYRQSRRLELLKPHCNTLMPELYFCSSTVCLFIVVKIRPYTPAVGGC